MPTRKGSKRKVRRYHRQTSHDTWDVAVVKAAESAALREQENRERSREVEIVEEDKLAGKSTLFSLWVKRTT